MAQRTSPKHPEDLPPPSDLRGLCVGLLSCETPDECERFLVDLCTPGELSALADRWKVARMLDQGLSYRRISERTGVSTATITRVARSLYQTGDGYRRALARLPKSKPRKDSTAGTSGRSRHSHAISPASRRQPLARIFSHA